ncbi:hypothetical protein GCM10023115_02530 [Pontixanthobacter gangjinensis]|uniref:HK97 family phage prohead protease n=1 Tax=Pontixanthobacter gangjinensis TaxID=1028742 RepID=A0A6I4SK01_9SPHN|nr:HK97 family phage prohead protease [Pontixanthobacter gangjinensis]MXO55506.1 HK97 family phage prohead protease [Pontixanthobacter gangjinensis]
MRFAGYAALFGKPDAAADTIAPNAFTRTLSERAGPLPLFWQHRPNQRVGWVDAVSEDARGLRVIGRLDNPGSKAAAMLANRTVSGLSFGYRARKFRKAGSGRVLEEIDLFEVSLVTHPLQHGARIHLVA